MKMPKFNKKGAAGLNVLVSVVVGIFVVALLAGILAITNSKMIDTVDDYNVAGNASTGYKYQVARDMINDSTVAMGGVSDYFSLYITVGALVGIISLVALVIVVIRGTGFDMS